MHDNRLHDFPLDDVNPPALQRRRKRPTAHRRSWLFVSLRWRVVLPIAALVIGLAAVGAYLIGDALAQSAQDRAIERVVDAGQSVTDRLADLGAEQQHEALRIAYTEGVIDAMQARDERVLHPLVEPLAAAADLDVVIVADAAGREVVGLQRVATTEASASSYDYVVSTETDLVAALPGVFATGGEATQTTPPVTTEITRTEQGAVLMTAQPVVIDGKRIGAVLVGTRIAPILTTLRGEPGTDLALYGPNGALIGTTFDTTFADSSHATLASQTVTLALNGGQVPVSHLMLQDQAYNAAYVPFVVNGSALGVLGVVRVDDALESTWLSRERLAVLAALLVGGVIGIAFVVTNRVTGRLEQITRTAEALAVGQADARTGLRADKRSSTEIDELGAVIDEWAARQQEHDQALYAKLRQQRRASIRLSAILESIPDGVVVQDLEGRVLMINEAARILLGGQRGFRAAQLHNLTEFVADKLGPALAPGIYALGDPTQIALDDKMLHAQAAAIVIEKPGIEKPVNEKPAAEKPDAETSAPPQPLRIGTVIILRDITDEVAREQRREELLHTLSEQALAPRSPAAYESLSKLAREVVRNTRTIQGVISQLRDLSTFHPRDLETAQRPIPANNLLWHVGTEWTPLARQKGLQVRVLYGPPGLYVLGDERRLRWALGNAVDNALKFSPAGTTITLAARHKDDNDDNRIEYIIRDEGYGIAPDELPHVFTRFYRGHPRDFDGQPVHEPGTGQGLFIARRVIEAHGGDVWLASGVGKGTTVIVRLPLTSDISFDLPDDADDAGLSAALLDEIPARDSSDAQPREAIIPAEDELDTVRLEPIKWDEDE